MMRVRQCINALLALSILAVAVLAETSEYKLHVYHKQGADYKKRGEIVGLPNAPSFVATAPNNPLELTSPLYQVKIRDEVTDRIILSSVKTCQLLNSGWKDEFRIHLDDQKQVYHVDYYAESDACPPPELPIKVQPEFSSSVIIERPDVGAKPLLGHFGGNKQKQAPKPRQQGGGENMDELPVEEEKTFFQKYWYLVLGGVLLLLNSMNAPPENAARR
ncbi:hypothetical protein BJV82DRAFT_598023 [Fennellomyces sp. T-0311]|nr:hypothetical protein BJV82DRAFT_598023 [Fennellomyces sp. T-0311]